MAEIDVPLKQLEQAWENPIYQINSQMTDNEKKFLSLKKPWLEFTRNGEYWRNCKPSFGALKMINLKKCKLKNTKKRSITKCTISMTLKYRLQIKKSDYLQSSRSSK
jgi:hypothetical protein